MYRSGALGPVIPTHRSRVDGKGAEKLWTRELHRHRAIIVKYGTGTYHSWKIYTEKGRILKTCTPKFPTRRISSANFRANIHPPPNAAEHLIKHKCAWSRDRSRMVLRRRYADAVNTLRGHVKSSLDAATRAESTQLQCSVMACSVSGSTRSASTSTTRSWKRTGCGS